MKIHKLTYRKTSDSPTSEFSFSEHVGGFERSWIFRLNGDEIPYVQAGLLDCFSRFPSFKNYYVRLDLFDLKGCEWSIECMGGHKVIQKSNRCIEGPSGQDLFEAQVQSDLGITESIVNSLRKQYLTSHETKMLVFPDSHHAFAYKEFTNNLKKRTKFLSEDIFEHFKDLKKLKPQDQVEVVRELSDLYTQYQFTQKEKEKFSKEISEKLYSATEYSTDYKKQLEIIEKVEGLYKDLSQSNSSISVHNEKIALIDEEIQELLQTMQLPSIPAVEKVPNWSEIFSVLCRYNVLEKLVRFTEKASKVANEDVVPLVDQFIKSLDNMVVQQEVYANEVESCIASVNVKLINQKIDFSLEKMTSSNEGQTQDQKIELVMNWFDKLKSKISKESQNEKQDEATANDLESLRLSLEYLLEKFVEIRVSLSQIKNYSKDDYLQEVESNYEKQLAALGKVKNEWKAIAKEMQLPEKMTIKQLMLIAFNYMRLVELGERKKILEDSISLRKEKIKAMTTLIESWRKSINSQKVMDLDSTSILMAEARSIIRYKSERTRKSEQQIAIQNEAKDDKRLLTILQERLENLKQTWMTVCENHNIEDMNIDQSNIDKIIEYKTRILELHDLSKVNQPKNLEESIDSSKHMAVNFWVWDEINIDNRSRINFLNTVEKSPLGSGLQLFFVSDQTVADFFVRLGAGQVKLNITMPVPTLEAQSKTVEAPKKAGPVVQSQTLQRRIIKGQGVSPSSLNVQGQNPPQNKSVIMDLSQKDLPGQENLSPRAKAVLDILNRKPSQRR